MYFIGPATTAGKRDTLPEGVPRDGVVLEREAMQLVAQEASEVVVVVAEEA